jgi:tetratricopeptide (TPR) repeat protein
VEVVTIVAGPTDRARVGQLAEELGVTFPVLFDPNRSLYAEFKVIVSPSTWFVDGRGELQFAYPGHRRNFLQVARADIEQLRGRISEQERQRRVLSGAAHSAGIEEMGPAARYRLARRLLAKGNLQAAEKQLRQAWEREPRFAEAGVELGLLLLEQGRNQEALAIAEQAAAMSPDEPRAMGAKGLAYIRAGRSKEGRRQLREALERGTREPLLFYEMALLSESLGQADDALRYYKRGLELLLEERRAVRGMVSKSSQEDE